MQGSSPDKLTRCVCVRVFEEAGTKLEKKWKARRVSHHLARGLQPAVDHVFLFSYIVSLNIFVFEHLNKVFLLNVKLLGNVFCALAFGLPCAPRLYPGLVSPPVPASRELGFPWERNGTSCWDGDAFDIYVLRTFIQGCSPSNFRLKIQRGTS